jgi:hypothetical protein
MKRSCEDGGCGNQGIMLLMQLFSRVSKKRSAPEENQMLPKATILLVEDMAHAWSEMACAIDTEIAPDWAIVNGSTKT